MTGECRECVCTLQVVRGVGRDIGEALAGDDWEETLKDKGLTIAETYKLVNNAIVMGRECGWEPRDSRLVDRMRAAFHGKDYYKFVSDAERVLSDLGPDCSAQEEKLYS